MASVWEGLCRQAVPRLEATLGAEHGPAARHWSAGGHEWDIVAESVAGGALLLGEAKWSDKAPSAPDVERTAQALMAKGLPAVGRAKREPRYAVFVSKRPKAKPKLPANVTLVDARDVLEALS